MGPEGSSRRQVTDFQGHVATAESRQEWLSVEAGTQVGVGLPRSKKKGELRGQVLAGPQIQRF